MDAVTETSKATEGARNALNAAHESMAACNESMYRLTMELATAKGHFGDLTMEIDKCRVQLAVAADLTATLEKAELHWTVRC